MTTREAEISRQQIGWVADEQVLKCENCRAPFTLLNRRHHCRRCGHIFCGNCSQKKCSLPEYGLQEAVRVCDNCFYFEERRKEYEKFKANFETVYLESLLSGQQFYKHGTTFERKVFLDVEQKALLWHKIKTHDKKEKIFLSRVKEVVDFAKLSEKELKQNKIKNDAFPFSVVGEKTTIVFYASSAEMRQFWVEGLKQAVHIYGAHGGQDENDDLKSDSSGDEKEKEELKSPRTVEKNTITRMLGDLGKKKTDEVSSKQQNAKSAISEAQEKLDARGKTLKQLDQNASQLADNSKDFASAARNLKEKMKRQQPF